MASSSAALSLYEKYTQLNHQVDETREKRAALQQQIEDTREALEQYETHDKPALLEATQTTHKEAAEWQTQADNANNELVELQSQRDMLVRSRDALQQTRVARQEERRMDWRNFLAESRTFRQRQCPQLHWELSVLSSSSVDPSLQAPTNHNLTRLWAIALANGWDVEGLPQDEWPQVPGKRHLEGLEFSQDETEDIDWGIWDTALAADETDDEDIRQKLVEYNKQRRLFEASQKSLQEAQDLRDSEVNKKYEACHRRKEQMEAKLQQLSKEVQQLEVDISTTLAVQDMETEDEDNNLPSVVATNPVPINPPPPNDNVVNPYRRRTTQDTASRGRRQDRAHSQA